MLNICLQQMVLTKVQPKSQYEFKINALLIKQNNKTYILENHFNLRINMEYQRNKEQKIKADLEAQNKNSSAPVLKQLRILDYRNGKYQGFTTQDSFVKDGLGILIDDNYSFVLSQWKQDAIEGPFFMVYPDQSILYGYIEKQKIGQIVCYEVSKQFNMILSKNSNIVLVDLLTSCSILVFRVDKKLLDEHNLESILKRKDEKLVNQEINTGITLLSQQEYNNSEQKYRIYQKKLSLSNIPEYLKSYDLFIRQKFNSTVQKKDLIEIVKTRQDFTVNFKTSAITLFMKLYLQTNQTKMIGSMNRYENEYEFYRKIMHSSNSIEQYVTKSKSPFTAEYNLRPTIRPKQCSVQLCNFHRGAVTYVNKFMNLNYMYGIKQNLQKVNKLINIFVTNKFAQVQLQNSRFQVEEDEPKQVKSTINYTLEEVQQQIYQAVNRKRQGSSKKLYTGVSPSRVTQYPATSHIKSNQKYSKSQIKKTQNHSNNKNSPYLRALHNEDDIYESRLNRSKSYMNVSNVSKNYELKATPTKNTTTKPVNQNTASGRKYAYLDDVDNDAFNPPRVSKSPTKFDLFQNMRKLTDDFEILQKQIHLSTPNENRSPYRLDNSIYRRNSTHVIDYDPYNQPTAVKHAPLSQKKVFKYLPN